MTREENINIKIQNGEKLTLSEALSVLNRYHFDWRCRQALDVVLKVVDPWHYPSKGDYPPSEKLVLCSLWDDDYDIGYFVEREEAWHFEDYEIFDKDGDVKAWQYIEPPKEEI